MTTTVEINYQETAGPRTQIHIQRDLGRQAAIEAIQLFLATLGTHDRRLVLADLCREFDYTAGDTP